jgi:hypothetical protein
MKGLDLLFAQGPRFPGASDNTHIRGTPSCKLA